MWFLYDCLVLVGLVVYLIRDALRGRFHPELAQRFGRGLSGPPAVGNHPLWIHAVSVGEALAVRPVVEQLRLRHPELPLVVSTITRTGQELAQSLIRPDRDHLIYFPIDLSWVVRRAFQRLQPRALILVETELWPNVLRLAGEHDVPVVIINGRFSPKSFRRYARVRPWIAPLLRHVHLACMRHQDDAERIQRLGVSAERVRVTGNLKFDLAPPPPTTSAMDTRLAALWGNPAPPVIVAGSTHPGEEAVVLDAWQALRREWPSLQLILAPRHVERTPDVEQLVRYAGAGPIRISALLNEASTPRPDGPAVVVLDTLGQLRHCYQLATVAVIGGSLIPKGGQNLIEPASAGKPILAGPHLFNFLDAAEALHGASALAIVHDAATLAEALTRLLRDPAGREAMGHRARAVVDAHRGATQRTLEALEPILTASPISK